LLKDWLKGAAHRIARAASSSAVKTIVVCFKNKATQGTQNKTCYVREKNMRETWIVMSEEWGWGVVAMGIFLFFFFFFFKTANRALMVVRRITDQCAFWPRDSETHKEEKKETRCVSNGSFGFFS